MAIIGFVALVVAVLSAMSLGRPVGRMWVITLGVAFLGLLVGLLHPALIGSVHPEIIAAIVPATLVAALATVAPNGPARLVTGTDDSRAEY